MSRDAAVGNVGSRVVKATTAAIEDQADTSTDTRARMLRHVERFGHDEYGEYGAYGEAVTMPSRAMFYRLVGALRRPLPDGGSAPIGRQPPSPNAIGSDGIRGRGARHGSRRFAVALGHPPRTNPGMARVHRMLRPPVVGSIDDKVTRCPGAVRCGAPGPPG